MNEDLKINFKVGEIRGTFLYNPQKTLTGWTPTPPHPMVFGLGMPLPSTTI